MLPQTIDADEKYRFLIDESARLRIILATREMIAAGKPADPLWQREAGDRRSLTALVRWVGIRRDQWSDWGALAERVGPAVFSQHMRDLMGSEPPVLVMGSVIQRSDDPREIFVGETVHGPAGLAFEGLYRHRFASADLRHSFYDWFFADRNCDLAPELIQVAYSAGTAALGEILDDIAAAGAKPLSRAERRRRTKAASKANA